MNNTHSLLSFLNGIFFMTYSIIFLAILFGDFKIANFSFVDQTWKKWLFGSLFLFFVVNILYVEFKGKK